MEWGVCAVKVVQTPYYFSFPIIWYIGFISTINVYDFCTVLNPHHKFVRHVLLRQQVFCSPKDGGRFDPDNLSGSNIYPLILNFIDLHTPLKHI